MAKKEKAEEKKAEKAKAKAEKARAKAAQKAQKAKAKAAKKAAKNKKPNRLLKYLRDTITEIKKIVWPAPKATFKNAGIVLVAMIIVGLVIFGVDSGLAALLGLLMNVA